MRTAAGWRVFVPAVVLDAVVQGLLVIGDPVPTRSIGFCLLVAASFLAIVLTVWLVTCAAAGTGPRRSVLVAVVVAAVVAVGAAVAHPLLPLLVLLLAAFVLPAVASGGRFWSGFTAVGAAPVRYLFAVIGFVVLCALSWVAALLLGLLVTGAVAAGMTWLWFGLVLVVVLSVFSKLYRRSVSRSARS